jgi:hypothetical protein
MAAAPACNYFSIQQCKGPKGGHYITPSPTPHTHPSIRHTNAVLGRREGSTLGVVLMLCSSGLKPRGLPGAIFPSLVPITDSMCAVGRGLPALPCWLRCPDVAGLLGELLLQQRPSAPAVHPPASPGGSIRIQPPQAGGGQSHAEGCSVC